MSPPSIIGRAQRGVRRAAALVAVPAAKRARRARPRSGRGWREGPGAQQGCVCFFASYCRAAAPGAGTPLVPRVRRKAGEGRERSREEGWRGGGCTKLGSSGNCRRWEEEIRWRLGDGGGVVGYKSEDGGRTKDKRSEGNLGGGGAVPQEEWKGPPSGPRDTDPGHEATGETGSAEGPGRRCLELRARQKEPGPPASSPDLRRRLGPARR